MESKIREQGRLDRVWLMRASSIQNKLHYYMINSEPKLLNNLFPCYLPKIDKTASFEMNAVYQGPITRSMQLLHIPVTAFSQTVLFLV